MGYVLAVTWVAKPGEEARIEQILRTLTPLARAEPGCVQFEAHRAEDAPGRFFLFEKYRDEAAFAAHCETPHFKEHVLGAAVPRLDKRERLFYRPL